MAKEERIQKLRAIAEHLRATKIPIGEKEAIEHILGAVAVLEKLTDEMEAEAHEAQNK